MPPPGRLKRALSSGRLDFDGKGRKMLSFQDANVLELPINRMEDEVASDDDKNNIEMVHEQQRDEMETTFDLPKIQPINLSDMDDSQ